MVSIAARLAAWLRVVRRLRPLRRSQGPYAWLGRVLQPWTFEGLRLGPQPAAPDGERIAYVLWRYPTLGDTFIRREIQSLLAEGVPVTVFALAPDEPPVAHDPASPSGDVTYFGPYDEARGRRAIHRLLLRRLATVMRLWLYIVRHRHRFDTTWWRDRDVLFLAGQLAEQLAERRITHVHSPWANHYAMLAFAAARLIGVTFSVQARASEIHRTAEAPAVADRLRFAAFVVTNSQYNARYLATLLNVAERPSIHVVMNGLDLERFEPPARLADGGPLRLLAVGRLVEPKGFRHLLQACARVRDEGLAFECEIIGGPVDPSDTITWLELRMLHSALELGSHVFFRGPQPFAAVLEACRRADLFVLPCVRGRDGSHDITPNSLLEAMAMELPVISTTSGAIPEIVEDGRNGLLVAPGDVDALARAIRALAADPARRRSLGTAARRSVELRFNAEHAAHARAALFASLRAP